MKGIYIVFAIAILAISAQAQIRTTDQVDNDKVIEIMVINRSKIRQEPRVKFSSRVSVKASDGTEGLADLHGDSLPGGKSTTFEIFSQISQNLGLDFDLDGQGSLKPAAQKIVRNMDGTAISVEAIGDGTATSGSSFLVQALWTKKSTSAFGLDSMTGFSVKSSVETSAKIELFNLFNQSTFYNMNPQVVNVNFKIPAGESTFMIDQLLGSFITGDDTGHNKVTDGYLRVTFKAPVESFVGRRIDNGHSFEIPAFMTGDAFNQPGTITASANYTGKKLNVLGSSTNSSAVLTVVGTTKSGTVVTLGVITNGKLKAKMKGLVSIVVTGDDGSTSGVIYF